MAADSPGVRSRFTCPSWYSPAMLLSNLRFSVESRCSACLKMNSSVRVVSSGGSDFSNASSRLRMFGICLFLRLNLLEPLDANLNIFQLQRLSREFQY